MTNDHHRSKDEIHDYWVNNSFPDRYKNKVERSEFLTPHVKKYVDKDAKVLEIGCNVGRNLNHLFEHGYEQLSGIDISEEALQELKKSFPKLADKADLNNASVEDFIPTLQDGQFDMVFTMAVLEHIHPDSEWIFNEIVRITSGYLIIVEAENYNHWRVFPRKYKEIFTGLGMQQVYEMPCEAAGLKKYTMRVFKK
ncbi:class I SAM-dependent methyltransferase [Halobacillus litoralis]|uniref:Class I SAM-dependent methyltransferase n=1 Tax=Halobacillus litoralis TaxID=45668 RepID=A0A410MB27_9BACI|nr:class I SAM-dependent methyltransferase [Halobacillus litoralis]QAS51883.1 class I SAM-dependent methyltransferase [Halobacillus litoralis]